MSWGLPAWLTYMSGCQIERLPKGGKYNGCSVLTKSGQVPVNTAKQSSHRVAASVSTARHVNTAASRPNVNYALPTTYSYFKLIAKVNNVTTTGPQAVVSGAEGKRNNVVKSSACWIWRPKVNLIDHIFKDSGSYTLKRFNYIDPQGRLKVLFTNTECVVLSPDFKLLDESQVLLKVPRNNNMYSFDLKNFVPVEGNLARGLPSKTFENDHTFVACQKGKQHKASWNQTNGNVGTKANIDAGQAGKKTVTGPQYVLLPLLTNNSQGTKSSDNEVGDDAGKKSTEVLLKESGVQDRAKERRERTQRNEFESLFGQDKDANGNKMFTPVSAAGSTYVYLGGSILVNAATISNADLPTDPLMLDLEDSADTGIFSGAYDDEVEGVEADFNNLELTTVVSPIPTTRIHKDHPKEQIIGDPLSTLQTRRMTKTSQEHAMKVRRLVYLPKGKHVIGNKWVYRNKKDERGIVVRNKGRLVAQGYTHEEGIDYDEVFAHVARIKAISQDKYVADILKKFDFSSVKTASTLIETNKALLKDEEAEDVDVQLYRSMIGSLMYLTASRPNIMFAICSYKGQPKLGLWYPRDSPFNLEAFLDSDYAGASLDKKSTTGGCQFLRKRLISWQCKKQTVVANSTTKADSIKYALTVNPNIYVSCIKQFWTTIAVKQVNDVTRLQALVDRKKVVVTEAMIREALYLDDAEGVDCLPNEEIFAELAKIGYEKPSTTLTFYKAFFSSQWKFLIHTILQCMSAKRTSWNEFSSSMTSTVMFIHRKQVGDLSTHTTKYASPALTHKEIDEEGDADEHVEEVNTGDDDSAAHREVPTVVEQQSIPSPTPPTPPPQPHQDIPSTSQVQHTPPQSPQLKRRVKKLEKRNNVRVLKLKRLQKVGTSQRVEKSDDTVMDDESNQGRMIAEMDQDDAVILKDDKAEDKDVADAVKDAKEAKEDKTEPTKVQEVVDVVTTAKLITEVVTAASETVTAVSAIITTAEAQVPAAKTATLTVAPVKVTVAPSRRRKRVIIRNPEEESTTSTIIPAETKSKDKGKGILVEEPKPLKKKQQIEQDEQYARELHAEMNTDIDWDEAIDHVKLKAKEDPAVKRYQVLKRKPWTEAQARKNMMIYLKNVDGFKLDYFKGMSYDDIRPIFEANFNSNVDFLLKTKEQIEEEESRALQMINETLAKKAAKRRKLNEDVEDLKRHL
nr:ribonuclease H-like domain, reverse transcriptase, RNA-dependent DNA polymerase [Tanacetum cinerariifolium]